MSTPEDQDDTETRLAALMTVFERQARAEAGDDAHAFHLALAHKLKDEADRRGYYAVRDPLDFTAWYSTESSPEPVPPAIQQAAAKAGRESRVLYQHAIAHMRTAESLEPPSAPEPQQR